MKKTSTLIFALALMASVNGSTVGMSAALAQPEEDFEDEIEEDFERDLEEEIEEEFEEEFEDEFEEEFDDSFEEDIEAEFEEELEEELEEDFEDNLEPDDDIEDEDIESEDIEGEDIEDEDIEDEDIEDEDIEDEDIEDEDIEDEDVEDEDIEDEDIEDEDVEDEDIEDEDGEDEGVEGIDEEDGEDLEQEEFDLEEIEEERDLEASLSATTEIVFVDRDPEQFDVAGGEWLVLSNAEEIAELEQKGFEIRSSEAVGLLDQFMVRAAPPEGTELLASRDILLEIVPAEQIDYNHLYQPQARFRRNANGSQPLQAMPLTSDQRSARPVIGLIDTTVVRKSPVFERSRIVVRDFVGSTNRRPSEHGTAIASILVGNTPTFNGLLPEAELYAASVFEILPGRGSTATTASLVRALQWMVENKVPVVNMSLTGPRNAILQRAIDAARSKNVLVVAAIGNSGPLAKPLYPAAYEGVVSVTAIDAARKVFRNANRGDYLDFSAPGVSILHANADGTIGRSTGTSIAAPFAVVAISLSNGDAKPVSADTLSTLAIDAIDLGKPGYDRTYGHGLIRPKR